VTIDINGSVLSLPAVQLLRGLELRVHHHGAVPAAILDGAAQAQEGHHGAGDQILHEPGEDRLFKEGLIADIQNFAQLIFSYLTYKTYLLTPAMLC
jgi:hypothetical protein